MSKIWRIAPDEGGKLWDDLRRDHCIAIGWDDLPDFRAFVSEVSLRAELAKRAKGDGRGGTRRIWRFAHEINVGDHVVVNRGESVLLGIGVVTSDYLTPNDPDNPRRGASRLGHSRRVGWIDEQETQLGKRFFGVRPNTLGELDESRYNALLSTIGETTGGAERVSRLLIRQCDAQRHAMSCVTASADRSLLLDHDADALEGERRSGFRTHYHRDQRLRACTIAGRSPLVCEACSFDFAATYGIVGAGFAHVHHEDAIADRGGIDSPTRPNRVRIVCANCHAMIHRFGECRTVDDIRRRIDAARQE